MSTLPYPDQRTVDHIGIAVKDLRATEAMYIKLLGLSCFHYEEVPDQGVKVGFIDLGQVKLELIQATSEDSPIFKFIEKRGEGMHHVAYAVKNIREELRHLEERGFRLIDSEPRKGALDKWVAFLHPRSTHGVLIELCEKMKPKDLV